MALTTILDLTKQALWDIGVSPPNSIISSTDPNQLQIKSIVYSQARFLRSEREWPQQKKLHTFSTTASRSKYPLPTDFYAMSGDTAFDQTGRLPLTLPISDAQATFDKYYLQLVDEPFGVRTFGPDFNPSTSGGQFEVIPTPSSTLTFSFEYLTNRLFLPPHWTTSTEFAASTYCNANGNIYFTTAGGTTGATIPSHTSGSVSDGTVTWLYVTDQSYQTIILDTDFCIFDDALMSIGIQWRYKKAKGLDFSVEYAEHQRLLDRAVTRWHGSYRGRLDRDSADAPRYVVPFRSWSI